MAVSEFAPILEHKDWYTRYDVGRELRFDVSPAAQRLFREYEKWKSDMTMLVGVMDKLEKMGDSEVINPRPDLPNVSSGETAGLIRRTARNLVQNTPNVEVVTVFDDDKPAGIYASHILKTKVIGSDEYSNDMQQNLFASTKTALTLGFDTVIPVLLQNADDTWYIQYDNIHYRDVFPEPGAKDVRRATAVYIRRYLTRGEVHALITNQPNGWDVEALKYMYKNAPSSRAKESVPKAQKDAGLIPDGYEIITWYNSFGVPFLTFCAHTKVLLRVEVNKHPLKTHPVHFLVLEKDGHQPLGKSQVDLLYGRQEFQDLMLNGAMKLWYRNINPSILGFGAINSIPNLSPGKYTPINNPNARIEPFEVNTQTLMQYTQIASGNLAAMVGMFGAADQQMAASSGQGFSATPQGVDAQQQMVDVTTNNYQKAIESFFSHYCSYALTLYFHELRAVKKVKVQAETRKKLVEAGIDTERFDEEGRLDVDYDRLAVNYFVRVVPGSLVEMEDEKQLRILNELFVPLSQAMPALAASGNQEMIESASRAMRYIVQKQIELSGASSAQELGNVFIGKDDGVEGREQRVAALSLELEGIATESDTLQAMTAESLTQLQGQVGMLTEAVQLMMQALGMNTQSSGEIDADYSQPAGGNENAAGMVSEVPAMA